MYFGRTKQQQEVDLLEEINGIITGYELEWNAKRNEHLPKMNHKMELEAERLLLKPINKNDADTIL